MDRDKTADKKRRFDWLPAQMPGVSRMIADKKREVGTDWVNTCWQAGVVRGEPGWFWATEGGLSVGTLWVDAAQALLEAQEIAAQHGAQRAPVVILRPQGV